jgi:hypothetical protein
MAVSITNWVLVLRPKHMNHMDSEDHLMGVLFPGPHAGVREP